MGSQKRKKIRNPQQGKKGRGKEKKGRERNKKKTAREAVTSEPLRYDPQEGCFLFEASSAGS